MTFCDLGGFALDLGNASLVSERLVTLDGSQVHLGLEQRVEPAPPWPPAPGADVRSRLLAFARSFRIRVRVT